MPHSLFLGSAFATQEREKPSDSFSVLEAELASANAEQKNSDADSYAESLPSPAPAPAPAHPWFRRWGARAAGAAKAWFRVMRVVPESKAVTSHAGWQNHSLAFVQTHLNHGIVDMVISLLGIAVVINALCVLPLEVCR